MSETVIAIGNMSDNYFYLFLILNFKKNCLKNNIFLNYNNIFLFFII